MGSGGGAGEQGMGLTKKKALSFKVSVSITDIQCPILELKRIVFSCEISLSQHYSLFP